MAEPNSTKTVIRTDSVMTVHVDIEETELGELIKTTLNLDKDLQLCSIFIPRAYHFLSSDSKISVTYKKPL